MTLSRPDPDAILAQVQAEDSAARRGSLKIFFGYAAGVGKTYAMLENARRTKASGHEVVVGYVEPHGRIETETLLDGLESVPLRQFEHRGVTLREFDVDAALARRPELLLVDELAHTNAEGSRHEKRWQDIDELLAAGINVWTTLNVQHIESLNDVIGQISGVFVRETIPDRIFDLANDLELVDISPEELIGRLQSGRVYVPEQAQRALQSFFQKGNLTALRELSFRQAARRVHTDVESARRQKAASQPWATNERLLVCVGPSPTTARVIRTAKRMATALDAPWLAVSVDLTGDDSSNHTRQRIAQHFRLAERLGAESVTLAGRDVCETLLEYARSRNVTKLFIGKTNQPRWRRLLFGTVVDSILEESREIDVYVIHGEQEPREMLIASRPASRRNLVPYALAAGWIGITGLAGSGLRSLHMADSEANTVMLFLASVAWVAYRYGRGPAIAASALAVMVFDFVFVPPYFTFAVSDAEYLFTFAVMLAISLVISSLTARLKAQVESTRLRERHTAALYELGKRLSALSGTVFLASAAANKVAEMVGGEVAIYLKRAGNLPEPVFGSESVITKHPVTIPAAEWVIEHDQMAGAGTNTLPNATAFFLPIAGSQRTHGACAIRVTEPEQLLDPETRRFLEACTSQLALALERDDLAIEAANARIQAEAEQVRSSLLSGVSHDLKTPLAAIAGASSSLLQSSTLDDATRRQLMETVADEALRLNRLLENILQMSKLDAGAATPHRQWHVLEEIVGSALHRTRAVLTHHHLAVHLPADLPLIFIDGLLLEQVFVNLLENAAKYTGAGTTVNISATIDGSSLRIAVADDGPGLTAGTEQRVFDKFYRGSPVADGGRGSGLGLAISRAIVLAHGGTIEASNRPTGGAEFVIRLPLPNDPPRVVIE